MSLLGTSWAVAGTRGAAAIGCPAGGKAVADKTVARGELEHYRSAGADLTFKRFGGGPMVVLLPGGPGVGAVYFEPVARALGGMGYQAVIPDLRGTGGSVAAGKDRSMLTVKGSVADIDALRCALRQERLRLIGHSFGGAIALAYAAAHPDRVSHLVALDSVGPNMDAEAQYDVAVRHNLTAEELAELDATHESLRFELIAGIVDRAKADALYKALPPDFVHPEVDVALDGDYDNNYRVTQQLMKLHAKVTLVAGLFDPIRVWEPSLSEALPQAPLVLIPGAAHLPWIDKPEETYAALTKALSL